MMGDIELPPLGEPFLQDHPCELWGQNVLFDLYTPEKMHAYARAAVLADRERRVSAEPVAYLLHYRQHEHGFQRKVTQAALLPDDFPNGVERIGSEPLYAAPPPTPPADVREALEMMDAADDAVTQREWEQKMIKAREVLRAALEGGK
jgi:hypothetical protein